MTLEYAPISNIFVDFEQAELYVLTCNHNNYKDWRLPTEREYITDTNIHAESWNVTSLEVVSMNTDMKITRYAQPVRSI